MTTIPDPGAAWLMSASSVPGGILSEWAASPDGLARIPVGRLFDVVRVSQALGHHVVERLQCARRHLGPVLQVQPNGVLEFLVPPGTAGEWTGELTVAGGRGSVLLAPMPGRTRLGRTWLYPPDGTGRLTDPGYLRVALDQARRSARTA